MKHHLRKVKTVDIKPADKMKWEVRLFAWALRKKLQKEYNVGAKQIHEDMKFCGNKAIRKLMDIIYRTPDMKTSHHNAIIRDFSELGLWVCYKDTAYRDPFFWVLNEILKDADQLKKDIAPYVKDPKDWYCPRWQDTKEHTSKLKEEGKIPKGETDMAQDETYFVPKTQFDRLNKITEEEKKKRGWK